MEKIAKLTAIRDYFSTPAHPVTMGELKELSPDERQYLAAGAAKELGKELE